MGDTDFCIDHLQDTEAKVIVEEMDAFDEDGALLYILIIECCVPVGMHI